MKNQQITPRNHEVESKYIQSLLESGSKVRFSFGGSDPIEFASTSNNLIRLHDILSEDIKHLVFIETNTKQGNELIKNLLAIPDSRVKSEKVGIAKSIVQQLIQPQAYHLQYASWFNYIEFLSPYEFIATHTHTNPDGELKNTIVFARPFGFYSVFKVLLAFDNDEVHEAVARAKELIPTVDYMEVDEKDKLTYPKYLDVYSLDEIVQPFDFVRRVESISENVNFSVFHEFKKKIDRGEHHKIHPTAIEICKRLAPIYLVDRLPYFIDFTTPVFVGQEYVYAYYLDCFNNEMYCEVPTTHQSILDAVKAVFEKVKADKDLSVRYKEALPAICQWWADKTFNNVFPQVSSRDSFSPQELLSDILLPITQNRQNKSIGAKEDKFKEDLSKIITKHIDELKLRDANKSFYAIGYSVSCALQLATDYSAIREPLQEMEKLGYSLPAKCYTGFNYDKGIFEGKAGYGGKMEVITLY